VKLSFYISQFKGSIVFLIFLTKDFILNRIWLAN